MMMGNTLTGQIRNDLLNLQDNNAQANLINAILREMETILNSRQLSDLNNLLQETLTHYSLSVNENAINDLDYHEVNEKLVNRFMETKRLIGLSERTLTFYNDTINLLINYCKKSLDTITTEDVREWFDYLLEKRQIKHTTLDNYRRNLNSFYNFCVTEGLIYKSPMRKIKAIKRPKQVKQPFSDEEIISLREHAHTPRDKAILEILLSSGMRVGEMVSVDIEDIDFNNNTIYIIGKGSKERKVFFNTQTRVAIKKYLKTRTDDNPALFVQLNAPHDRLGISGVETRLREIGKKAGVNDVHPHRFRRSMACGLLRKDVPIEQIRVFLGHANLATTQLYLVEDDKEIHYNHKRYVN